MLFVTGISEFYFAEVIVPSKKCVTIDRYKHICVSFPELTPETVLVKGDFFVTYAAVTGSFS